MFKASPPVHIADWDKSGATAAESPTDSQFTSVGTTYVRMRNGKAVVTNAAIPNFQHYERGRISFGDVAITGAPTGVTLEFLGLDATGIQRSLGTSKLADGAFPAIEFDVTYEKYFLRIATLAGGTAPTVTVKPLLQGFFRASTA